MFLLIAVLALLSAALLLIRYAKRRTPELSNHKPVLFDPPSNAKPLFAPTDAELRKESNAEAARDIARREHGARAASRSQIDQALTAWRDDPCKKTAVELLQITAEDGLDGDFARGANEILNVYREAGIDGLNDDKMAALLDSHIRLVSIREAGSGELFWLKQEVARLRSGK